MKRHLVFLLALAAFPAARAGASEASWIFRPSRYTHDPNSGERVAQYAKEAPAYKPDDSTYEVSGYRQSRSSLSVGDSYDYLHIVETWGRGETIRPYGEWLYPYRAGATPFGPWGNPQGPWTTPFGSWVNPYGLGRLPNPPWSPWGYVPYRAWPGVPAVAPPAVPGGSSPPGTAAPAAPSAGGTPD